MALTVAQTDALTKAVRDYASGLALPTPEHVVLGLADHDGKVVWRHVMTVGATVAPPQPQPPQPTPTPPEPTPPPQPSTNGWPGADTTGVPAGVNLTARGNYTVSTAGAIVQNLAVTGAVMVNAPNVTIRSCRFTGNGERSAIVCGGNHGGLKIEDCEVRGNYVDAAIIGGDWSMTRTEITGLPADGIKMGSNTTVTDCWLHDFKPGAGAHADGIQIQDGVTNAVIRHNAINTGTGSGHNAALFICPDFGPTTNGPVTIENNLLGGGGFTVYVVDGNNGQYYIRTINVVGNRWQRGAQYGPARVNVSTTWRDNGFIDGGAVSV